MKPEELAISLRAIASLPKYKARDGSTFCNILVSDFLESRGYHLLRGLLANRIFDYCLKSEDFEIKQPEEAAWQCKQNGALIVAATKGEPHGHVALVYPDVPIFSSKWNVFCPWVATTHEILGNGVHKSNFVFRQLPNFYQLKEDHYEPKGT